MSDLKLEAHRKHEKRKNDTGPRTVRKRRYVFCIIQYGRRSHYTIVWNLLKPDDAVPVCGLWIDYKQKHVVCSKSGSSPLHAENNLTGFASHFANQFL